MKPEYTKEDARRELEWYGFHYEDSPVEDFRGAVEFDISYLLNARGITEISSKDDPRLWRDLSLVIKPLGLLWPWQLNLTEFSELASFAGFEEIRDLTELHLISCPALEDASTVHHLSEMDGCLYIYESTDPERNGPLRGLAGLKKLSRLTLFECPGLSDTESLRGLTIDCLTFRNCHGLKGPAALAGLEEVKGLEMLIFDGCDGIGNTDVLPRLSKLKYIDLGECQNLKGREALLGLLGVKTLTCVILINCPGLKREDVQWLSEQLPSECQLRNSFGVRRSASR
jgi:hypothetical protein